MLRIIACFIIVSAIALCSCTEPEVVDAIEFYEIGDVDDIFLTVSSDLYVEGGDPIELTAVARDEFNDFLTNIGVQFTVNDQPIEGNSFIPDKTGIFWVRAVIPEIDFASPIIEVFSIYEADVGEAQLVYSGPPFLTTNPWSIPQDFYLEVETILEGRERVVRRKFNDVFMDGDIPFDTDAPIAESGVYDFYAKIGNSNSQSASLEVREEPEIEEVSLPIIVHQLGGALDGRVVEILEEANEFLSNTHESLLFRDNPNKVATGISLMAADTDPDGEVLDFAGLNVVLDSVGDLSSSDLLELARQNYWDPNKYINIYFSDRELLSTIPVSLLGVDLGGAETVSTEPSEPIFNAIFIGDQNWRADVLAHEFGHFMTLLDIYEFNCTGDGDFLLDTYAYLKVFNNDASDFELIIDTCGDIDIVESNVMSEIINVSFRQIFTFDQRERMRQVIEYGLFLPSPKNLLK